MADRWNAKHDHQQELDGNAERLAHDEIRCEPKFCPYCLDERNLDDMIDYVNKELDNERNNSMTKRNDIILESDDVTVKPIEAELCECEEATIDSELWIDLRTAGMSVVIGRYCKSCADEIARRIRGSVPPYSSSVSVD